eukprot:Hpha_TRINITY_DN24335_c0_g1::TRINITY_DN24335_c0_g1_i1::g.147902::m.147902
MHSFLRAAVVCIALMPVPGYSKIRTRSHKLPNPPPIMTTSKLFETWYPWMMDKAGKGTGHDNLPDNVLGLPVPEELAPYAGRKGGPVTTMGCTRMDGLNNQRQALQMLVIFGVLLRRRVVLPLYSNNTHSAGSFGLSHIYDLDTLRKALAPLRVDEVSEEKYARLFSNATEVKGSKLQSAGWREEVEIIDERPLVVRNCYGSPEYILRYLSAESRRWVDVVVAASLKFHPSFGGIARDVLSSARKQLSGTPLRRGVLHAVHLRVKGPRDTLNWQYPPDVDCSAMSPPLHRIPCWSIAGLQPCGCLNVASGRSVSSYHRGFCDYDCVLRDMLSDGRVRPGDGVFIGTNYPPDPRVKAVTDLLSENKVKAFVGLEGILGEEGMKARRNVLPSPMHEGAAELLVLAGATGEYVPACASSYSEHVLELRGWFFGNRSLQQRQMFVDKYLQATACENPVTHGRRKAPAPSPVRRRRR